MDRSIIPPNFPTATTRTEASTYIVYSDIVYYIATKLAARSLMIMRMYSLTLVLISLVASVGAESAVQNNVGKIDLDLDRSKWVTLVSRAILVHCTNLTSHV